jgi:hypothetical protein
MNAKETTHSIVMVSKVTAVVNLFRATFPKLRVDLAPWGPDDVTTQYVDPESIDIGFHFPGRHPACQCRSILVQVHLRYEQNSKNPAQSPEAVAKIELAGYDHQGQCWWFSTASYWQFMGNFIPELEQRDQLRALCGQIYNLFISDTAKSQLQQGLSREELLNYFGLLETMVAAAATESSLSTDAYLQKLTGWTQQQQRCYYPPGY